MNISSPLAHRGWAHKIFASPNPKFTSWGRLASARTRRILTAHQRSGEACVFSPVCLSVHGGGVPVEGPGPAPPVKFKLQLGKLGPPSPSPDMFKLVYYVAGTVTKDGWMAFVAIILNTLFVK